MSTHPHSDNEAQDALYRACGRKVRELLSQSDAETWIEDLWDSTRVSRFSARKLGMIQEVTTGLFL